MTDASRSGMSRIEPLAYAIVVVGLATIPLWSLGWWTALPFATVLGGYAGGRWVRWFWALPLGFVAGSLAWGLELALLPADPRSRLADILGAAQGVSGTLFTLLGPILFGVVAAAMATALAGGVRLVVELRRPAPSAGPSSTGPGSPQ